MPLQPIRYESRQGADFAARLTLRDGQGALVTTWTTAASLAASATRGGPYAPAFLPSAAWIDPTLGTIRLSWAGSATAAVAAGLYPLTLTINGTVTQGIGTLKLSAGAGLLAEPATACDLADMVALLPWLEDVEDLGPGLAAGVATNFLAQRAEATHWLYRQVEARAYRALDYQQRISGPNVLSGVGLSLGGYDSGPWYGDSTLPDTVLAGGLTPIRTALASGGVGGTSGLLDPDGQARRIVASYAIFLALRHQASRPEGMDYGAMAMRFRSDALMMLVGWTASVDADGDGAADYALLG